jgi:mannose-1-phosphate guanylyltransferase
METQENRWILLLAGNKNEEEDCLDGFDPYFYDQALQRAKTIAPSERIFATVSRDSAVLHSLRLPEENIFTQPFHRGTALEILLPLLEIIRRDPHANVLVMPCHYSVEKENIFHRSLSQALSSVGENCPEIILLGMKPDHPCGDYDWILPSGIPQNGVYPDVRFLARKDGGSFAQELMRKGGLWYSGTLVAPATTLLLAYAVAEPDLFRPFFKECLLKGRPLSKEDLALSYSFFHPEDFSNRILNVASDYFRALPVPSCGWTTQHKRFPHLFPARKTPFAVPVFGT